MRQFKNTGRKYEFPDGTQLPVVESKVGTLIVVTKPDVARAVQLDPFNCALACALKRSQGASHVLISGTVAYISTNLRGEKVALKYTVPPETRDAIVKFDKTGVMPAEGFRLIGISPGRSLEAMRRRKRASDLGLSPKYRREKTGVRHRKISLRNVLGRVHTIAE